MKKEEEYNPYLTEMQNAYEAYEQEREKNQHLNNVLHGQMSLFGGEEHENLIRWQLDLREEMDRIYHLLKGHQIKYDERGNLIYVEPIDNNLKPFNEFGVQLIMNIMSFYINKNTILSNYSEEIINWKVLDFGNELADLVFNRYEEMGMDNDEKIKMYPMIIKELVDTVHSAYLRALRGGERESLRTARTVHQSEPLFNPNINNPIQVQNKAKWWNPATW